MTKSVQLIAGGQLPVSVTDIEVAITKAIDTMPSQHDVQRVSDRLRAGGWTVTEHL
jgi:hypothetical protein